MMSSVTLGSESQLVLPAEVRRKLGIRPGDRLIVELDGDRAVIRKAPRSDVDALANYRSDAWRDYADELQRARDEWVR